MQDLITVFGGSGFVGQYVVRALAQHGFRVRVAVRKPNLTPQLKVMGGVGQIELSYCNVRNPALVAQALRGSVGVVNLVGVLFESGRQSFKALHEDAAATIARAAAAQGVTRFVQMSALGADPRSASAYGRSKAAGEEAVREAIPTAAILRPSIVFGPEDDFFNRFAAMTPFTPALPLFGGGGTKYQPVYAGDVGAATAAILSDFAHLGGRTYALGGPGVYSFKELMEIMLREVDRKRTLLPLPFSLGAPLAAVGDVQSAILPLAPILTTDQLAMLKTDNVPEPGALGLAALGVEPTALEAVLPTYLWRFRKGGQFAQPEGHNA